MKIIYTLGRQPALGLAELEMLYGGGAVRPAGPQAAIVETEAVLPFARIGGSTRQATWIGDLPAGDWAAVQTGLEQLAAAEAAAGEGKLTVGLSYFGRPGDPAGNPKRLNASGLSLKKALRAAAGRPVRIVPNTAAELNSAQVIHNRLDGPAGLELVICSDGSRLQIGRTVHVQDIAAYAARDQQRPRRDARVGMLPPKLAQIIVNLATAGTPPSQDFLVLDPFCGTGVVLQEAALAGFGAAGSDLEPRMVEYSRANLEWLLGSPAAAIALTAADATDHRWQPAPSAVACETYLGRPLSSLPAPGKLQQIISDVDTIHRKFLANLAAQTPSGTRACFAVPAWKTPGGFKHLKTLEHLAELGYNRHRFVHVRDQELIYHRPNQLVARELVVVERI